MLLSSSLTNDHCAFISLQSRKLTAVAGLSSAARGAIERLFTHTNHRVARARRCCES